MVREIAKNRRILSRFRTTTLELKILHRFIALNIDCYCIFFYPLSYKSTSSDELNREKFFKIKTCCQAWRLRKLCVFNMKEFSFYILNYEIFLYSLAQNLHFASSAEMCFHSGATFWEIFFSFSLHTDEKSMTKEEDKNCLVKKGLTSWDLMRRYEC